jgi:hypothetical protein
VTDTGRTAAHGSPESMLAGIGSFAFGWTVEHGQPRFDEHALLRFVADAGSYHPSADDRVLIRQIDCVRPVRRRRLS